MRTNFKNYKNCVFNNYKIRNFSNLNITSYLCSTSIVIFSRRLSDCIMLTKRKRRKVLVIKLFLKLYGCTLKRIISQLNKLYKSNLILFKFKDLVLINLRSYLDNLSIIRLRIYNRLFIVMNQIIIAN